MSFDSVPNNPNHHSPASAPAEPSDLSAALNAAIRKSQDYLLGVQTAEGYWVGELLVDVTLVSDMVAYHHWAGDMDPAWQTKAVKHIFDKQLPDGGWNIYYGGPAARPFRSCPRTTDRRRTRLRASGT